LLDVNVPDVALDHQSDKMVSVSEGDFGLHKTKRAQLRKAAGDPQSAQQPAGDNGPLRSVAGERVPTHGWGG
jgi:hypothetical protein